LGRAVKLLAAYPIGWTALQIHDCQDSDPARSDGIEKCVRKTMKETSSNLTLNYGASLWMLLDGTLASFNLVQKRRAKARCLELVILGGLV
jgi:hypothetical protein